MEWRINIKKKNVYKSKLIIGIIIFNKYFYKILGNDNRWFDKLN